MATVQVRNKSFRVLFCYQGKRRSVTLGKVTREEADRKADNTEYLLLRLKQKLIAVPPWASIEEFVLRDGQVEEPGPKLVAEEHRTFARLSERYLDAYGDDAMEGNSLATVRTHLGHFERTLSGGFPGGELSLADLQRHVNRRRGKLYRGRKLSPVTLK